LNASRANRPVTPLRDAISVRFGLSRRVCTNNQVTGKSARNSSTSSGQLVMQFLTGTPQVSLGTASDGVDHMQRVVDCRARGWAATVTLLSRTTKSGKERIDDSHDPTRGV
jgi:hypothetical protein